MEEEGEGVEMEVLLNGLSIYNLQQWEGGRGR